MKPSKKTPTTTSSCDGHDNIQLSGSLVSYELKEHCTVIFRLLSAVPLVT